MTTQISKSIASKMYSFNSRFNDKDSAKEKAAQLNREKHAYYTKVQEKGVIFFDVRTEN